jgi:hypothetical protein
MLTTVDLDDQLRMVACKVGEIRPDLNLSAKVRSFHWQTMPQVAPKFAFGLNRLFPDPSSERALRWRHRTVSARPRSILVLV